MERYGETNKRLTAATFPGPFGWTAVVWRGVEVTRIVLGSHSQADVFHRANLPDDTNLTPTPGMEDLVARLQRYSEGGRDDFQDIAIDWSGRTPFQRAVLKACRQIPYGTVMTYGQLAVAAGGPRSARAVGNVMAGNWVPLIIPCHRVVAKGGALGGFSAPDGLDLKFRLLNLEGAPLPLLASQGAKNPKIKRPAWASSSKLP